MLIFYVDVDTKGCANMVPLKIWQKKVFTKMKGLFFCICHLNVI